jgi:hypothetical protein
MPKKPSHANVPLKEPSGQVTVDRPEGCTIAMPWFGYPRRYVSHFTLLINGHIFPTHCTDLPESEPHIMIVVYFSLHVCRYNSPVFSISVILLPLGGDDRTK